MKAKTLKELLEKIEQGQTSELTGGLMLNLDHVTFQDVNALLEVMRYKAFGHALDIRAPKTDLLIRVRNLINQGEFQEVVGLLAKVIRNEDLDVEYGRALMFLGRYEDALPILDRIWHNSINTTQRGVVVQMLGHASLELGLCERAEEYMIVALTCARAAGNLNGLVASHLMMSRVYVVQRRLAEAWEQFDFAGEFLRDQVRSARWLMAYYRQRSMLEFHSGNSKCVQTCTLSGFLAQSLNDRTYEARARVEQALMAQVWSDTSVELPIFSPSLLSGSLDLKNWDHFYRTKDLDPSSTRTLVAFASQMSSLKQVAIPEDFHDVSAGVLDWIYDSGLKILFTRTAPYSTPLSMDSMTERILHAFEKQRQMSLQTLFETVWELHWKPELHTNVVEVALGRLRKSFPDLKIVRHKNSFTMESRGVVV